MQKSRLKFLFFFFLKAVLALGIFFFFFIPLSYMARPELSHARNNTSGFYAEPKDSLDVVFVGGSTPMSAFIPTNAFEKEGFTSYNFCINRMATETMVFAAKELLKTQNPELVVFDMSIFITHNVLRDMDANDEPGSVRINIDSYRYSLDRAKLIWDNLPHNSNLPACFFDFLQWHDQPLNIRNIDGSSYFFQKGFQDMGWDDQLQRPYQTKDVVPLDEVMDKKLTELLEQVRKLSFRNVLFINYPTGLSLETEEIAQMDDYKKNRLAPEYALEKLNYIQKRIEEAGYPFLNCVDYYPEFGFDEGRDFYGPAHWTVYGAEKITNWLTPWLKEHYDLPDHRKDPSIALRWNDDVKHFHTVEQTYKELIDQAVSSNL